MSGCPVHIWAPMMGAAIPVARVVRDKVRFRGASKGEASEETSKPPTRWAPIGAATGSPAEEEPATS